MDPMIEAPDEMQAQMEPPKSDIVRTEPDPDPARDALIKDWLDKIAGAKTYWEKKAFKPMRFWAKFARGEQWPDQMTDDDRYQANLTLRNINQKVSAIYAKNPKVVAERRPQMYHLAWDGSQEQLKQAQLALMAMVQPEVVQQAVQGGVTPPPTMDPEEATQIMKDYQDGLAKKALYTKMGKALEIVAQYSLNEPIPKFKTQAKQLVRRVATTGVGYCKLGYQRIKGPTGPDVPGRIRDIRDRLQHYQRIKDDLTDGEIEQDSKEAEELRAGLAALEVQENVVLREGLVFTWPRAWSIIPDMATSQLKGFIGAEWIAEEFLFPVEKVQEFYGIDVKSSYTPFTPDGTQKRLQVIGERKAGLAAVYEVYDLVGQVTFTVCTGYNGYLVEPKQPDVDLEQYHPYYPLTFNDCEDEDNPYPPSDVEMMVPIQREYNRSREAWRVHRIANRPAWFAPRGVFGDDTKSRLASHVENEVIEHDLGREVDMEKMIQSKPVQELNSALYDVEPLYNDLQRVGGRQAANLGGTSGATATEVGVAEASRSEGDQSNVDDLDEFLSDLMRGAGKALLLYMGEEMVRKIAGAGAVWPKLSRQQVAEEMYLDVRAGSSGRPNKQGRMMAIEKGMPLLMQIPDIDPLTIASMIIETIDDTLNVEDFRKEGTPSITQLNNAKQAMESGSSGIQGPQGQANSPTPQGSPGQTQNLNPAAGEAQAPDSQGQSPLTVQ